MSSSGTQHQESVDISVAEFLLNADSKDLIYDLRETNCGSKDTKLDLFWEALDSDLNNNNVVMKEGMAISCICLLI